jgi:hypothetical protein
VVQDNHDTDAEIIGELSDFENESELEYTDEEYFSEDDLESDLEEVNRLVLSTAVLDDIETLVEQEKPMYKAALSKPTKNPLCSHQISISFFWLHNLVFHKPFCSYQKSNDSYIWIYGVQKPCDI